MISVNDSTLAVKVLLWYHWYDGPVMTTVRVAVATVSSCRCCSGHGHGCGRGRAASHLAVWHLVCHLLDACQTPCWLPISQHPHHVRHVGPIVASQKVSASFAVFVVVTHLIPVPLNSRSTLNLLSHKTMWLLPCSPSPRNLAHPGKSALPSKPAPASSNSSGGGSLSYSAQAAEQFSLSYRRTARQERGRLDAARHGQFQGARIRRLAHHLEARWQEALR